MKEKKNTLWTLNFTSLFITNLVLFLGQFMMNTLLPKYLSAWGFSASIIGIVVSMFSVTAICTRPITGPLIDGMDKKKLYIITLLFTMAASFGYALSPNVVCVAVSRLLHGVGIGSNSALGLAIVTEILPEDQMGTGISIYGLSNILSSAVGPGIGLAIANTVGYRAAFAVSGCLLVCALILSTRLSLPVNPNRKIVFSMENVVCKEAIIPAFFTFLLSFSRAGIMTYLVIYVTEYRGLSTASMTVYYVINALVMIFSRTYFGRLTDRKGFNFTMGPAYLFFGANLILLAFCTTDWMLYLCSALNAIGYGSALATHQTLTMKMTPPEHRGAGSTTNYLGMDFGDLLGPTVCGFIVTGLGYETMYLFSVIPLALCAILFYTWFFHRRKIGKPVR